MGIEINEIYKSSAWPQDKAITLIEFRMKPTD